MKKQVIRENVWRIGKNYLIRTVTMIYTGRLVQVTDKELVIDNAAWIPETERWADCIKNGTFREVEPYLDGNVIVGRGALLDACVVLWSPPRVQK